MPGIAWRTWTLSKPWLMRCSFVVVVRPVGTTGNTTYVYVCVCVCVCVYVCVASLQTQLSIIHNDIGRVS